MMHVKYLRSWPNDFEENVLRISYVFLLKILDPAGPVLYDPSRNI